MSTLLQIEGVGKSFGGLKAVQNVSLSVTEGRLSALIGPNGAGKTTLFALMSGFLTPDTGRVVFAGQDLTVAGRKRLELARALATRPRLLLLDEVLAGLNPQEIAEMIPVVQGIAQSGVTVLMIEHVMQAVMSLAQEVWVLAQGQLIAQGTPAEVTNNKAVVEAYLGHGTAERLQKNVAKTVQEAQA